MAACDLLAISPEARAEHISLGRSLLFLDGQRITELSNGLAFELPALRLGEVARFVENERRCCAHLRFDIEIPPRNAAISLRITGNGVREGLAAIVSVPEPPR